MWYKIAELLPMWMAPNLVTFIGFIFIMSSYIAMLFYDFTCMGEIPNWLFIKAGIEVIIY